MQVSRHQLFSQPWLATSRDHPVETAMRKQRRFSVTAAVCLSFGATLAIVGSAKAQTYPTRPVHLIVGLAAGSSPDILARHMGQSLSQRLGQAFVIENRPGAGTNIATEAVVRSAPDGYTLLLVDTTQATNATLYDHLKFNFIRDIAPVASFFSTPFVLVVHPSVPARTLPQFIAYAKANPGKLNIGSPGKGTGPHLSGELFKSMTGVDMVYVHYRGSSQMMSDLIAGHVQVTFIGPAVAIEHIQSGTMHALAVTAATRSEVLPDVQTVAEVVPGYESSGWFGIGAPSGTPPEIIEKLNKVINAVLADPATKARFAELGGKVLAGSPDDFRELIANETEKKSKVVKFTGMKPD
jgi:tripartite-type tricarboxylate transporter receptor subunit TctC